MDTLKICFLNGKWHVSTCFDIFPPQLFFKDRVGSPMACRRRWPLKAGLVYEESLSLFNIFFKIKRYLIWLICASLRYMVNHYESWSRYITILLFFRFSIFTLIVQAKVKGKARGEKAEKVGEKGEKVEKVEKVAKAVSWLRVASHGPVGVEPWNRMTYSTYSFKRMMTKVDQGNILGHG